MPVTQEQIEALNDAIASGVRQVTLDGQTVTYNTSESLIKARDDLIRQLEYADQATSPAKPKPRRTFLVYGGRGYQ